MMGRAGAGFRAWLALPILVAGCGTVIGEDFGGLSERAPIGAAGTNSTAGAGGASGAGMSDMGGAGLGGAGMGGAGGAGAPATGGSTGGAGSSGGGAGQAAAGTGGLGGGGSGAGGAGSTGTGGAGMGGGSGIGGIGGGAATGGGGTGAGGGGGNGGGGNGGGGNGGGGNGGGGNGGGGNGGGGASANPSCQGLAPTCGPTSTDDCCAASDVPGGAFTMGSSKADASLNEKPPHVVTVSGFRLDSFEVTVGRFRKFLDAYDSWQKPQSGDGAVPGVPASGWSGTWDPELAPSANEIKKHLICDLTMHKADTWTATPASTDNRAMNCATWFESFAFCIWDGGRLPTEAEWEYAAVGGDQQRTYPWGDVWVPSYANYFDQTTAVLRVGATGTAARSRWGQYDLMGNLWETVRDRLDDGFYGTPDASVANPVNLTNGPLAVQRGLSWYGLGDKRMTVRWGRHLHQADGDTWRNSSLGFRCAR